MPILKQVRNPVPPEIRGIVERMSTLVAQDRMTLVEFADNLHDLGFVKGYVKGVKDGISGNIRDVT
jgi:hypothetical protein